MERPPATYQVSGSALRTERMDQGLGLQQVADAAGITASYLSRLETGVRTRMRPATYHALRKSLTVTDNRLLVQE
ncbi:helix-turn-helix domain-containing protein [Streptomyces reniochalinae]|uniref:XRE family transcriptional regulator n=1 Tax=Streptomyces reniochalinae TaxID=2250578 RepID=A0A367EXC3_9ACTN|nr:helix-turn-helix transcriptional regulator [Streptomyces reniochalinae]RCG21810.1 XRE family transcriptional regulator [Streptomyces reniochalinae]